MTFEEFFKKKKISLDLLQTADLALFAEFKAHFEQMGDKSFDHTKKYWFNKLRRQYPLPVEPKVEKVRYENQIAEQTITETLAEEASPAVKPGFQPRFKKPMPEKSLDEVTDINKHAAEVAPNVAPGAADAKADDNTQATAPQAAKPAFKPRFKPGVTKPEQAIPEAEPTRQQLEATPSAPTAEQPVAAPAKPAFKPRFKPGVTKVPTPADEPAMPTVAEETNTAPAAPANTAPVAANVATPTESTVLNTPVPSKPTFKPRFKPGVTKTTAAPEPADEAVPAAVSPIDNPASKADNDRVTEMPPAGEAPKPAYKPRFSPKMVKPKPPEEE
jgi:hypothetical protein